MTDYNNTFPGATGSTVDASDLDAQLNNIATSLLSKGNIADTAFTGTLTHNTNEVWNNNNSPAFGLVGDCCAYGHQVLPSGFIIQYNWDWGIHNGVQTTANFNLPFPNACLNIVASINAQFGFGEHSWSGIILSNTQFQLIAQHPGDNGAHWVAIGY